MRVKTPLLLAALMALQLSGPVVAAEGQSTAQSASADEETLEACLRVMAIYKERVGDKPGLDPNVLCSFNARPLPYWECAESEMQKGANFLYATDYCERTVLKP